MLNWGMRSSWDLRLNQGKWLKEEHFCEPKEESLVGADAKKRSIENLSNYLENSKPHEKLMSKTSNEVSKPYAFKNSNVCMISCHKREEDGKPSIVVTEGEER